MTETAKAPTPRQVATEALKADHWSNPGKAVKVVFDAFDAAGVTVGRDHQLTADDLSEQVDVSMTCVGLALGAAGAMLTGDDAAEAMAAILQLWPDDVPDAALTIGVRVALTLSTAISAMDLDDRSLDATDLGTIAATILDNEATTEGDPQ